MELSKILHNFGFTEKEAEVYLALLELGESLPSTIARITALKRPTVYVVLKALVDKGIVSHVKRRGVLHYIPLSPDLLFRDQQEKIEKFSAALPDFLNLYSRYQILPQMSIYEGKEGIIQIMEDTLTTSGEIFCWSNVNLAVKTLLRDYHPDYLKKKIQKKIWSRCLFLDDEAARTLKERSNIELREVYFIPKEKYPFRNEINIYDDKMSIISHEDNIGIIIQNAAIAETQKSIFRLAFDYAKLLNL